MKSTPWAKTVLRSRHSQRPDRILSTFLVRMPRCILAEWNTHRALSRNAASTRAIPTQKLINQVITDPFIPLVWGTNIPGMQAGAQHINAIECEYRWLRARDVAVRSAKDMLDLGLHKQIVGRILEPWMWTIVCASGTEWSNFLALRDHPDAEPHIQILAREVRRELEREDNIQTLEPGEWHLPFIGYIGDQEPEVVELATKKSVACCASTSYKTVDGFDMTLEKAIELHDKLVGSTPLHASPAEHVAQADTWSQGCGFKTGLWGVPEEHGNFKGFRQYRKMLHNECL